MAQIHALTTDGRLPTAAVAHVKEIQTDGTGVRRIDDRVATDQGWNAGTRVYLLRQGMLTSVTVMDLGRATAGTGYTTLLTLPSGGFAPALDQYFTTWRGVRARLLANGTMQLQAAGTPLDYFTITYLVTSPIPDPPYPGTPG